MYKYQFLLFLQLAAFKKKSRKKRKREGDVELGEGSSVVETLSVTSDQSDIQSLVYEVCTDLDSNMFYSLLLCHLSFKNACLKTCMTACFILLQ